MTANAKKPANAVVLVQRDANGVVCVRDANGKSRRCDTAEDYRAALEAILDDDTLPAFEEVNPREAQMEQALTDYATGLAPAPLQPLVKPALRSLRGVLERATAARRPSPRRARRHKPRPTKGRYNKGGGRAA